MALNKPLSEGTRPFKMHRSVIIYQPSSGARTPKSLPSPDPPTSVTETQRQGVWGRTELTLYRILLLNHSAFSCPSCLLPSIKSYFHQNQEIRPLCVTAAAASWFGQMTFPHTAVSCVSRGKAAKPPLRRFSACSGVPAGSSCPTSATASCS